MGGSSGGGGAYGNRLPWGLRLQVWKAKLRRVLVILRGLVGG